MYWFLDRLLICRKVKMSEGLAHLGKGIALAGMYLAAAWFGTHNPNHAAELLGALAGGTMLILFFF